MFGATIDLNHLSRYTGGNESINAEVLRLFETQTTELVGKLQSILEAADAKSWKEVTHALKGAAKGVGAFSFAEAVAAAEPIDPARDHEGAERAMVHIRQNAEAVKRFVDSYLAR